MQGESCAEYHRRRASEEAEEARCHAGDITAPLHRRLAAQHRALARQGSHKRGSSCAG
jgi:hypothetical protein